jgi:hypothetical protein
MKSFLTKLFGTKPGQHGRTASLRVRPTLEVLEHREVLNAAGIPHGFSLGEFHRGAAETKLTDVQPILPYTAGYVAQPSAGSVIGPNFVVGSHALVGPNFVVGSHALVGPNELVARHALLGPDEIVARHALVGPDEIVCPLDPFLTVQPGGVMRAAEGAFIDGHTRPAHAVLKPGEAVGFNPQPDPPGSPESFSWVAGWSPDGDRPADASWRAGWSPDGNRPAVSAILPMESSSPRQLLVSDAIGQHGGPGQFSDTHGIVVIGGKGRVGDTLP